jgi:putative transposase
MQQGHHLRVHRYSQCQNVYSVTFCTINRQPYFLDFRLARMVVNAMKFQDEHCNTTTLAFVVMPDHIHWLFSLNKSRLDKVLHGVKSFTAHQFRGNLWQDGYYEHNVRKEQDLVKISRYIVANPLRAKLVEYIGDYPFCDAVWLNGEI